MGYAYRYVSTSQTSVLETRSYMSDLVANLNIHKGEMFDLEALSRTCAQLKRYSFFLTSMALNMPGGVSSPPNAMAIF